MPNKPAKKPPRRVTVPGTGPKSADGPEPTLEPKKPPKLTSQPKKPSAQQPLSERDRWILEEKPPHY